MNELQPKSPFATVIDLSNQSCTQSEYICGGLAQLGEHNVRNVGVRGSSPLPSTKTLLDFYFLIQERLVEGSLIEDFYFG